MLQTTCTNVWIRQVLVVSWPGPELQEPWPTAEQDAFTRLTLTEALTPGQRSSAFASGII